MTAALRTLIVDDEPLARRRLRRLLSARTDVSVVGDCDSAEAAFTVIRETPIDLLVMDVEMPGTSGLDFFERLPEPRPAAIFVTAHDGYAARAFDAYAVDYVLKPVRAARLSEAVRRVMARRQTPATGEMRRYPARLAVAKGDRLVPVPVERIDWIEAAENYVTLHCGGEAWLYRSTMADVANELDPAVFVRIHRSVIVNAGRVSAVVPQPSGDAIVELVTSTRVRMSRSYRAALDRLLTGR